MTTKNEKKRIILSQAQRENMAAQSHQKNQAFVGELNMVQSRRFEVGVALLAAHVTAKGAAATSLEDLQQCRHLAEQFVQLDAVQKWTGLKALAAEVGIEGPQPHLEWAAKQVGVELFEQPSLILAPDVETSEGKAIQ
jgi:hypothetical protein